MLGDTQPSHRKSAMNGYPASLEGEQTVKEGTVTPEALTEILGGYIVTLGPLLFEPEVRSLENCSVMRCIYVGDEVVCLLDGLTRLVDEGGLDLWSQRARCCAASIVGEYPPAWRSLVQLSYEAACAGCRLRSSIRGLNIHGSFRMRDVGRCKFFVVKNQFAHG